MRTYAHEHLNLGATYEKKICSIYLSGSGTFCFVQVITGCIHFLAIFPISFLLAAE